VENTFFDQLSYVNYYNAPQTDVITDLEIKKMRFPILWEKHQPALDSVIDWQWAEEQIQSFQEKNIEVIAGLVHHGSGPVYTNLLDENFSILLAEYAKRVALKFPFIKYYTPINEPLTTARFSGLYGLWYPHEKDTRKFLLMLLNQLKGIVLSMQAIRTINPEAQLVQTEDLGKTYSTEALEYQARFENERRWLTYDLLCGRVNESHKLWKYFTRFNIPVEQLNFFLANPTPPQVFGFNYYVTSERYLDENILLYPENTRGGNGRHLYSDVEVARVEVEVPTGLKVLLKEAWQRYKAPIALTEVHLHCHREEQLRWFEEILNTCKDLKKEGLNIKGITAWAILGSYGWDKLLTGREGNYEPGVYDMRGGKCRPTALCHFIKRLNKRAASNHDYLKVKGWWQRNSRLIYNPPLSKVESIGPYLPKLQPILIIGKTGTLGRAFSKICAQRALPYVLIGRKECDIAEPDQVDAMIEKYKPWAIINAAGYVRVDDAEKEKDQCFRGNITGPEILSKACHFHGVQFVTFSSDLVFDGTKSGAYLESDFVNPLNIYGISKAKAEEVVQRENAKALIIRTSAFFGPWDEYNFIWWVRKNLENENDIPVANNISISPTYVPDLVNESLDLLVDEEQGIWHLINIGNITWSELAYETARLFNLDGSYIQPVSIEQLHFPAIRPLNTVLSTEKGIVLPSLSNALHRYMLETKDFSVTKDLYHQAKITA
jgi:dTDP-4-dehydrorhamnose reductase